MPILVTALSDKLCIHRYFVRIWSRRIFLFTHYEPIRKYLREPPLELPLACPAFHQFFDIRRVHFLVNVLQMLIYLSIYISGNFTH